MIAKSDKLLRKLLARVSPGLFSRLYSTLDSPQRVPVQEAAYRLAVEKCVQPGDRALDVGFGLGYGLEILGSKASALVGIDVDRKAVESAQRLVRELAGVEEIRVYDGKHIPYADAFFDVVTCVDVIEHVPDYTALLLEMVRVSRRAVLVSTPNRRPEYTRRNGRPRNPWHLREWSYAEFDDILGQLPGVRVEWHFLNGPWDGPFEVGAEAAANTLALTPILWRLA